MLAYVLRRLALSLLLLWVVSLGVFLLVAATFDPLATLRSRQPPVPRQVIAQRTRELGLDQSLLTRYWDWLTGLLRGDLGPSTTGLDIEADLAQRAMTTARMVVLGTLLAVLLTLLIGLVAARRQNGPADAALSVLSFVLLAVPVFWLAGLLVQLGIELNERLGWQVFLIGDSTPGLTGDIIVRLADQAKHLVFPTLVVAAVYAASWGRFHRAAVLETMTSDYVRAARAKGLSRTRVLLHHATRAALIPLTTLVALDFGALLGGIVLVEQAFGWHGMGEMLVRSIGDGDTFRLLAWLMVSSTAIVTLNLAGDIATAWLDPRTRHG
jgi:peptide/nickel transport system permease protein